MEYLFFDIECCDGSHICEFGYVITDEMLEPIKQEVILINPDEKFNLGWRSGPKLYYPFKQYFANPKFDYYYGRIKDIIQDGDRKVVGHAAYNDAGFLKKACERYGLPLIAFSYFDSQKLLRRKFPDSKAFSLESACSLLGAETPPHFHKSDDDALATAAIVRKIMEREGVTAGELFEKYKDCCGSIDCNGKITDADVVTFEDRLERARRDQTNRLNVNNRKVLEAFIAHVVPISRTDNGFLRGKKVAFSRNYEKNHFREMLAIIQLMRNCGARYSGSGGDCDYFVRFDDFDESGQLKACSRLKSAEAAIASGRKTDIISLDVFLRLLGINGDDLSNMPFPSEQCFKKRKNSVDAGNGGTR